MFLELTGKGIDSYCESTHTYSGPGQDTGIEPVMPLSIQKDIDTQ